MPIERIMVTDAAASLPATRKRKAGAVDRAQLVAYTSRVAATVVARYYSGESGYHLGYNADGPEGRPFVDDLRSPLVRGTPAGRVSEPGEESWYDGRIGQTFDTGVLQFDALLRGKDLGYFLADGPQALRVACAVEAARQSLAAYRHTKIPAVKDVHYLDGCMA